MTDINTYRRHPNREGQERRFWDDWIKQMSRYRSILDLCENSGDSQQATTIGAWKKDLTHHLHAWEELSGIKLHGAGMEEKNNGRDSEASDSQDSGAVLGVGQDKPEAWRRPHVDSPEAGAEGREAGLPEHERHDESSV